MSNKPIDFTKPLQTQDGRKVELVTAGGRGKYPVIAYIGAEDYANFYTATGQYFGNYASAADLMNVPPEPAQGVHYYNLYKTLTGLVFTSRAYATRQMADQEDSRVLDARIGCQRVVFVQDTWDE